MADLKEERLLGTIKSFEFYREQSHFSLRVTWNADTRLLIELAAGPSGRRAAYDSDSHHLSLPRTPSAGRWTRRFASASAPWRAETGFLTGLRGDKR